MRCCCFWITKTKISRKGLAAREWLRLGTEVGLAQMPDGSGERARKRVCEKCHSHSLSSVSIQDEDEEAERKKEEGERAFHGGTMKPRLRLRLPGENGSHEHGSHEHGSREHACSSLSLHFPPLSPKAPDQKWPRNEPGPPPSKA